MAVGGLFRPAAILELAGSPLPSFVGNVHEVLVLLPSWLCWFLCRDLERLKNATLTTVFPQASLDLFIFAS